MATLPKQEGDALINTWDYKGRPSLKSSSGGWASAAMILVVEANERLTTLGIAVNLVTYLTGTMHLGNATSANNVTNFLGSSFMFCLLGGFVADTFLGRYLTIGIFTAVQATGVTILTISTIIPTLRPPKCSDRNENCIPASGKQLLVLYMGMYLTALGTGGLKSSVSGFGSDQFDDIDTKEKKLMIKFFNWFYFVINIGALGAVTVLVYIQDNVGRPWGYGICACSIVLGLLLFLAGTKRYRFKKLVGSPLSQIAAVFVAAWKNRGLELPSDSSLLFNTSDPQGVKKIQLPHTDDFLFLDKASIKKDPTQTTVTNKWQLSTLTDVEEVKQVIRMLPTWATTIIFWTVYAQVTTFSVSQATTMDRRIGSFEVPAASLTAFFVLAILLTVPIYDSIIFPIFRRLLKNPNGLSPLQRIWIGLVLSILAMAVAALTEVKRLGVAKSHGLTHNPDATLPISVFWLAPQFLLVGSGEAFTYIGQLDFFLKECPKGMKTMSTGLFLSTLSFGLFFSSILVTVVHKVTGGKNAWLANNLNEGKLYYFYWLLTIISILNMVVFVYFARRYEYLEKRLADHGIELEDDGPVMH